MSTSAPNRSTLVIILVVVLALLSLLYIMQPKQTDMPANVNAPVNKNVPANVNTTANVNTATGPDLVGTYINSDATMITAATIVKSNATTVTITGSAVGSWYFEASFPVEIRDSNNVVIGSGHAEAQSDWMVPTLVPFTSIISLNAPYSGPAVVVLRNDNPSGMPENDKSVSYDITL